MLVLSKDSLQEKISLALRFTTGRGINPITQSILIKIEGEKLKVISTNLNDFFSGEISLDRAYEKKEILIDPKKINEFLGYLSSKEIKLEITEKKLKIYSEKNTASFEIGKPTDFPYPPKVEGKEITFSKDFFKKELNWVIFASAKDETRPVLTGVYFLVKDNYLNLVATDGFRLSLLVKDNYKDEFSLVISSKLLAEIGRLLKEKEVKLIYSLEKKLVRFDLENQIQIVSRLIEGEFPPFEKVIPKEKETSFIASLKELINNIRLVSVFSREYSNIVFFDIRKNGVYLLPKGADKETQIYQEAKTEGREQKIAFNYKFILEFLNNIEGEEIVFEMTQPFAPAVFKVKNKENFLHIIMPIRTEE